MPNFRKREHHLDHETDRVLSKEEMEAKAIISWKSPERIFKARSKKYFTKVALYAFIFILLAIAIGEYVFIGVIMAVVFVVYVLATAAPQTIEHKITNMGIISGGRAFLWEELDSFWFEKRGDDRLLMVQTDLHFPTRLIMLLTNVSERTLLELLEKHLHYHPSPVHTLFDKWAQTLQKRINFE